MLSVNFPGVNGGVATVARENWREILRYNSIENQVSETPMMSGFSDITRSKTSSCTLVMDVGLVKKIAGARWRLPWQLRTACFTGTSKRWFGAFNLLVQSRPIVLGCHDMLQNLFKSDF